MGFQAVNMDSIARFNSANSSDFLSAYTSYISDKIRTNLNRPKSRILAPSSLRCARKCWFRLRGSEPDVIQAPDTCLQYTADVGTSRHQAIQTNLSNMLGDQWLSVDDYLSMLDDYPYDYSIRKYGMEYQISIEYPPIRFACDGIIVWNDKIFLLEIKTTDYSSWNSLTEPKSVHMDQIKCYCTLLKIHDALVLYEDRQYGEYKCYELHFTQNDFSYIKDRIDYIMEMTDHNLAPEKLPQSDYMCKNCEYQKKCLEWG